MNEGQNIVCFVSTDFYARFYFVATVCNVLFPLGQ